MRLLKLSHLKGSFVSLNMLYGHERVIVPSDLFQILFISWFQAKARPAVAMERFSSIQHFIK